MRTDPELQAQFRVAQELGWSLSDVRALPIEEFHGWLEYLAWQSEAERRAFKEAKNGKGRARR